MTNRQDDARGSHLVRRVAINLAQPLEVAFAAMLPHSVCGRIELTAARELATETRGTGGGMRLTPQ